MLLLLLLLLLLFLLLLPPPSGTHLVLLSIRGCGTSRVVTAIIEGISDFCWLLFWIQVVGVLWGVFRSAECLTNPGKVES